MNFQQNVNEILDHLSVYNTTVSDNGSVLTFKDGVVDTFNLDRVADSEGGSRQVRRRYKRELLKRIQYALWAAQRKVKVQSFPEARYVPYRAPWSKYTPHIGAKQIARYS